MAVYHPLLARSLPSAQGTPKPKTAPPARPRRSRTAIGSRPTSGAWSHLEHRAALAAEQQRLLAPSIRSGGEPLPSAAQQSLGATYGERVSDVRLHRDIKSAEVAQQLSAKAFTLGQDVFWPGAKPDWSRGEDRTLLSHEVAHAAQGDASSAGLSVERQPATAPTVSPEEEYLRGASVSYASIAGTYVAVGGGKRRVEDAEVSGQLNRMREALGPIEAVIFGAYASNANQPAAYRSLRAAYEAAVAAVIEASAKTTSRSVQSVYRVHETELPEWAVPRTNEPNISTPLPMDASVDRTTGSASTTVGSVKIVFETDRRLARGVAIPNAPRSQGQTRFEIPPPSNYSTRLGPDRRITAVTFARPFQPTIIIRTTYVAAANLAATSAYGRGTTREDAAAGTTSLRFHEGRHGLDFYRYVSEHPFPTLPNLIGLTMTEARTAMNAYAAEVARYSEAMEAASEARTDCVGTRASFCSP